MGMKVDGEKSNRDSSGALLHIDDHGKWNPIGRLSEEDFDPARQAFVSVDRVRVCVGDSHVDKWFVTLNVNGENHTLATLTDDGKVTLNTAEPVKARYNGTATIVDFDDGTTSKAICKNGEAYDEFSGLMAAIANRFLKGNRKKKIERLMEGASRVNQPQGDSIANEGDAAKDAEREECEAKIKEVRRRLVRWRTSDSCPLGSDAQTACLVYEMLLDGYPNSADIFLRKLTDRADEAGDRR